MKEREIEIIIRQQRECILVFFKKWINSFKQMLNPLYSYTIRE